MQIRAETPKLESAARQATNSMPEGHDSSEQETPSTSTLMSLSPLSFASSLTTQQHEPPLPPTSVSSGFVAAASPSFLSTEFLPPSHDYPTFPQNPQDPIDEESFAAMEDAGHQRPRSRISSSSSTLTPIASGGSSPAERREDVEMVESEPRTRQRERTTTANESDQDVTMSGRSIVSSSKPPASFIYKLYDILEDPMNSSLLSYGRSEGSFEVHDIVALARDVLPRYFRHSNFASFARQLNMWGWRKESRYGGWVFVHPIFRAGRQDLLRQIKRSDEAAKKRPESVLARRSRSGTSSSKTPESPRVPLPDVPHHRYPNLDIAIPPNPTSSSGSSRRGQPRSAPASVSSSQAPASPLAPSVPQAPRLPSLEGPFTASRNVRPDSPLISPLFNPDGSHTRPVLPPSFVDAPRPYLLPPPIFRGPDAEQRRLSFESSAYSIQLEEVRRRLSMTTSLLEHVLDRLGIDENHEKFRSFPFYVFDPRFQDPNTPMQVIVSEWDARNATAPTFAPNSYPPATSYAPRLAHQDSSGTLHDTSSQSTPFRYVPHTSSNLHSRAATFPPNPTPQIVPSTTTFESIYDSTPETRHGSFDSNYTATSPEDGHLVGLGISSSGQPYPGSFRTPNQYGDASQGQGGSLIGGNYRPPPARGQYAVPPTSAPTLGPSSFSLVDFSISQQQQPTPLPTPQSESNARNAAESRPSSSSTAHFSPFVARSTSGNSASMTTQSDAFPPHQS